MRMFRLLYDKCVIMNRHYLIVNARTEIREDDRSLDFTIIRIILGIRLMFPVAFYGYMNFCNDAFLFFFAIFFVSLYIQLS